MHFIIIIPKSEHNYRCTVLPNVHNTAKTEVKGSQSESNKPSL